MLALDVQSDHVVWLWLCYSAVVNIHLKLCIGGKTDS